MLRVELLRRRRHQIPLPAALAAEPPASLAGRAQAAIYNGGKTRLKFKLELGAAGRARMQSDQTVGRTLGPNERDRAQK